VTAASPIAVTRPEQPYPGLRPFEKDEWAIFFGRERMIDEVIARLAGSRLVLIHGISGSGKSSLVRAGVLPKLALQYRRHDAPWLTCAIRPSGGPLWNLAAEFARLEGHERDLERISAIAGEFNAHQPSLASIAASLDGVEGKSVCILVDQFEELFRYEKETSRDEAELFVDLIERTGRAAIAGDEPDSVDIHVIVTMRSEFLGECARFAGFAETINRTQYLVPRMDDDGLMHAVRRPAQMYGAEFDERLAERLIASVRGREDELPLLQHGLMLMWEDAKQSASPGGRPVLSGRIVDEAGGLAELLSRHADAVMVSAAHDQRGQSIVEAVFRALTDVNSEGSAIRRPLPFANLCAVAGATPEELRPILNAFRAPGVSFLTPYAEEPIDDKTVVDISHEALIRCWRTISEKPNGWLQEEVRDGLAWRALLYQAETFANDRESFLSQPATEVRADWLKGRNETWAGRYGGGWTAVEALINASRQHWKQRADEAEEEELRKKAEQERRVRDAERIADEQRKAAIAQRRTAQVAIAGLVIALLVAAAAIWQYFAADLAKKEALTQREVAVQAQNAADAARKAALAQRDLAVQAEQAADQAKKDALTQLHRAEQAETLADQEKREAQASSDRAKASADQAEIAQSRFLADLAHETRTSDGDAATAAALAVDALPDAGDIARPFVPEAELQLDGAWRDLRERLVLPHDHAVFSAAFSPDGRRIVTASDDKTVRIWDPSSGKPIGEPLKGHEDSVRSVAFSPDGTRIVTGSWDKTARIWDAETGKPVGEPLRGHEGGVLSAAFSPDGKRIVTASDDKTARIWDAATGKPIGEPIKGHEGGVRSAAFSPDGRRIVTASWDKTARIWDAASGKPIGKPLEGHEDWVNSAVFSPDGKRIVTASDDKTARIWDAATGKPIGEPLKGHEDAVGSAAFSPDGKRIVTASGDKTARIWDAETGRPIGEPLGGHEGPVTSAAFSPDGKRIVTASSDRTARIWDAEVTPVETLPADDIDATSAAFSPDGKRLIITSWGEGARLWDATTGRPIGERLAVDEGLGAAFSPDGKLIVTASRDHTAQIWDAATGQPVGKPLRGHDDVVNTAVFSPDGRRIVTASDDKTARIWDATNGEPVGEPLSGHGDRVTSAVFSPDGKRIVTASWDSTARLWDAETGKPIGAPLIGHRNAVFHAAFSPDGNHIVTASGDRTARIWDAATGKPIGEPLKVHGDVVTSAEFSPDGKRIVTASWDHTARLWDAATGGLLGELRGHEGWVRSATFSPDGGRIVTASEDKTARVWEVFSDTQGLVSQAESDIPRCLTQEQRKAFFLPPEPPSWCIEMAKWPYDTPEWKQWLSDVRAGKNPPLPAAPKDN
jgi:WD40 repeat protein/signal transduction histidine kinase